MKQWTHVWIRDGVSKYLEVIAGIDVAYELSLNQLFNTEILQAALQLDTSYGARPVLPEDIFEHEDIQDVIDNEIYGKKGATILRWIQTLIGDQKFQISLMEFIKKK